MNELEADSKKGEEKMESLNFERRIPAPDEIHSGLMFNEYKPEGRTLTAKDILLGCAAAFILLVAYCVAGYLELAA